MRRGMRYIDGGPGGGIAVFPGQLVNKLIKQNFPIFVIPTKPRVKWQWFELNISLLSPNQTLSSICWRASIFISRNRESFCGSIRC